MQISSICSSLISFIRTRHHFPFPLRFTRCHHKDNSFSSSNANGGSICSIIGSHGHCGFGVLPACYSFLSMPSASIIGITSTNTRYSRRRRSRFAVVSASGGCLERFTERAIKAVIYSQREAKELGRDMVFPQHLLLGLIAEEEDHRYRFVQEGFLGSGISLQQARDAVCTIWHRYHHNPADTKSTISTASLPFSISTKRVFEAAVHHSRISSHHFIAPEHISIALFTVDDGSAARVITRYVLSFFHFSSQCKYSLNHYWMFLLFVESNVSDAHSII